MRNDSYVEIPDRLKCTSSDGDYVALSNQIVTPSNPDDLEHSTLRKQSDINDDFDYRIINLNNSISGKQDVLSDDWTTGNIKTINNQSILGKGNLTISGGGSQTQSDWAQTNQSAADYIKNKPSIPTVPTNVSAFTNDSGYLTGIATNSIGTSHIIDSSVTKNKLSSQLLQNIDDSAYIGDDDGTAAIADLSLNDIVRTNVQQDFTVSQSETLKQNVFNKEALNYTVGSGFSVVYLKQHIDNQGDNILTLSDFGDPLSVYSTIFIIDKEFIVQGTEEDPVVIPPNCKLLFLGGEFKNGYINVNGAEILPNYGNLKYNSFDSSLYPGMETTIIGTPKKGSWYFDRLLNLPVYFNGTDWILADGKPAFE